MARVLLKNKSITDTRNFLFKKQISNETPGLIQQITSDFLNDQYINSQNDTLVMTILSAYFNYIISHGFSHAPTFVEFGKMIPKDYVDSLNKLPAVDRMRSGIRLNALINKIAYENFEMPRLYLHEDYIKLAGHFIKNSHDSQILVTAAYCPVHALLLKSYLTRIDACRFIANTNDVKLLMPYYGDTNDTPVAMLNNFIFYPSHQDRPALRHILKAAAPYVFENNVNQIVLKTNNKIIITDSALTHDIRMNGMRTNLRDYVSNFSMPGNMPLCNINICHMNRPSISRFPVNIIMEEQPKLSEGFYCAYFNSLKHFLPENLLLGDLHGVNYVSRYTYAESSENFISGFNYPVTIKSEISVKACDLGVNLKGFKLSGRVINSNEVLLDSLRLNDPEMPPALVAMSGFVSDQHSSSGQELARVLLQDQEALAYVVNTNAIASLANISSMNIEINHNYTGAIDNIPVLAYTKSYK